MQVEGATAAEAEQQARSESEVLKTATMEQFHEGQEQEPNALEEEAAAMGEDTSSSILEVKALRAKVEAKAMADVALFTDTLWVH